MQNIEQIVTNTLSKLNATIYLNGEGRAPNIGEGSINSKDNTWVPNISIPLWSTNLKTQQYKEVSQETS